jgi:hypothetical protein
VKRILAYEPCALLAIAEAGLPGPDAIGGRVDALLTWRERKASRPTGFDVPIDRAAGEKEWIK